jgi:hypothetical protein
MEKPQRSEIHMVIAMICCFAATTFADELPVRLVTIDKQPPERPYAKIVADFNGDGLPDIAIGGAKGPLVWYAYPTWKKRLVAEGGYQTVEGEPADIDNDGDQDIVMGGIVWYENPGATNQSTARPWTAHRVAHLRTHDVEVGDLDGDGKLDIVTRNQSSFGNPSGNRFHVWRQQTPDNWSGLEVECPHGEGIKLSDLDRDGDLDVIIGTRWYENTGDILKGPWTEHIYSTLWKHADTEVQCHDLNNDGRLDIVLTPAELKGGIYHISWFKAPEDAKTPNWREHVIEEVQETVVHALGVADINNDGKTDVVIAEMHQGTDPDEVRVYLNQGGGLTWTREVLSATGSHDIVLADIGADGDIDIVGANHAGSFQAVQLWENLTSTAGKSDR